MVLLKGGVADVAVADIFVPYTTGSPDIFRVLFFTELRIKNVHPID
jgi:hypothetical protein